MLTRLNCDVLDMGVVPDAPEALERAFGEAAAAADVVITSGGVSVGEADYVKAQLDKLGEVLFWKIAMKPGRPLAYGRIGGAHFFGLPGNPVAGDGHVLRVRPRRALRPAGPARRRAAAHVQGAARAPIRKLPGRMEFQRGILAPDGNGGFNVRSTGDQGSGILSSMSQGELLHRAAGGHRQLRCRRSRRRSVARGTDLSYSR
jgi:molybdopterin molybdotransferase